MWAVCKRRTATADIDCGLQFTDLTTAEFHDGDRPGCFDQIAVSRPMNRKDQLFAVWGEFWIGIYLTVALYRTQAGQLFKLSGNRVHHVKCSTIVHASGNKNYFCCISRD